MRLRSHLDLNTKALTWWVTPARTAGQEEGLWRIKQRFCFVTIVTEVQTGLLIKGKHDTIKFSLLISRKNKTKYEKHFFAQKVRSISLLASYPYFLDQAFLAQTNCTIAQLQFQTWSRKILCYILSIQPHDIWHSVSPFWSKLLQIWKFLGWSSQISSESHRMLVTSLTKIKSGDV